MSTITATPGPGGDHRLRRVLRSAVLVLCLAGAAPVAAQETQATEVPEATDGALAEVGALAAVLAEGDTRHEALLNLAALARMQQQFGSAPFADPARAARSLGADVDWLRRLEERFGRPSPRSPVLDPAAWRLRLQLARYGLPSDPLLAAPGRGTAMMLGQVFDRQDPALAAVTLPELLWQLEVDATLVWDRFLREGAEQALLLAALEEAGVEIFPGWRDASGDGAAPAESAALDDAVTAVADLARESTVAGPPDPARVPELRRGLLGAMPRLEPGGRYQAGALLHLAGLLDDLQRGELFRFTEGVLAITAQLVEAQQPHAAEARIIAALLADSLPQVSEAYAHALARVDPRLNSAVAAAYDVALALSREEGQPDAAALRQELADAVARLALMIPDIGFYFDLPVRDLVAGGVDACAAMVAERHPDGGPAMTRELFDDCLQSLLQLADRAAREAQLAGDPKGPFGESQLARELTLTTGQRINYGIGYLYDRYATGCEPPAEPLPNPIEWAFLATFMSWLGEQAPVFFQTPENEQRLVRMREIGLQLVAAVSEQVDCIAGAGAGINDPVNRVSADYRARLGELGRSLEDAEAGFRERVLKPGADIDLAGGAGQSTAYRPADLAIGPCDPERVCEMGGTLGSTRALVGLFPEPYLVADQARMGSVEICYDDLGWVERRSEPVRPGDDNVANYHGRLAFTLRGRFRGEGEPVELFAFRFQSPEEHLYLFGAASEEVLADACPVEWIGQRIVTELPEGRRAIVPNRLTYLSAPRTLPSRLLAANWDKGAEWRDWFVTGLGVDALELPEPPDVRPALDRHLQRLRRQEQEAIYGRLLDDRPADGEVSPLNRELAQLGTAKALLRMQLMLFYPHVLTQSDTIRAAVAGYGGLLDAALLNRFREEGLTVEEVFTRSQDRLNRFQQTWRSVPEAVRRRGSMAESVSHALVRLNALYAAYFSGAASGEVEAPSAPPAREPGGEDQVEDGQGDGEAGAPELAGGAP